MKHIKSATWKTVPGPEDIKRTELSNGIVLLTRPNFDTSSVVVTGYLASGSWFDPPEKLGLAYYTAQGLMRGTQRYNHQEIFNLLESAGASLSFGASVRNVSFGGRSLAEDLPLMLDTLAETMLNPTFPADQMEKLRARLLTNLAIRAQDTADMASITFDRILFGDHPYGFPEDGFPETVQNIVREDLVNFHKRQYGPRGLVIVIVGAVSPLVALDEVERTLGGWSNPDQPDYSSAPDFPLLENDIRRHISIPGKSQSDLVMGAFGPSRQSPDYLPASLGNNILGQFGMMGRIGDVVREQAGLAYHASTSLNAWIDAGSWEVSAGVNPVNLQKAIDLIISELERFVKEPVTTEELTDSQSNYIGRLPLSLESNSGVANALLNIERFNLGLDYYRRYPQLVREVTVQDVLDTARRYIHPSKLVIVSAGTEV
jgi:zinc protease